MYITNISYYCMHLRSKLPFSGLLCSDVRRRCGRNLCPFACMSFLFDTFRPEHFMLHMVWCRITSLYTVIHARLSTHTTSCVWLSCSTTFKYRHNTIYNQLYYTVYLSCPYFTLSLPGMAIAIKNPLVASQIHLSIHPPTLHRSGLLNSGCSVSTGRY